MRSIAGIGQYYPGDSILHSLDPRLKMGLVLIFMISIFLVSNFVGFALIAGALSAVVAVSGLPPRWILRSLRPLSFLILLTMLLHSVRLVGSPGTALLVLGGVKITGEGLTSGAFFALRLLLLVVGSSLLTLTTTPIRLTDAIEALLRPLARFGVPAHEIAMMMTVALRFIPTLVDETDKIMRAQMARGADFESGNLIRRTRAYIPLLVPLFVSIFRTADELAMAMESRCYRGGEGRTRLRELAATRTDWAAGSVTIMALAAIVAIGRI